MFCQNLYSEHAALFGQNRPLSENSIGAITNCFTESIMLCESLHCCLDILDRLSAYSIACTMKNFIVWPIETSYQG